MEINTDDYKLGHGANVDLAQWPTRVERPYESKKDYRKQMKRSIKQLSDLQYNLYASNSYALLVIFQAMDAAGKDSVIKHVMSGINPQGCEVTSFKHPSLNELEHDFLWRTTQHLPERGTIGIFNRSYYEEVLVVRVHPEILEAEGVPDGVESREAIWEHRYESIRNQEEHLHRNGTRILKFFLHVSPEEQRLRFLDRIDEPEKNWKFNIEDVKERAHWDDYMSAYEQCQGATSTEHAPWYIVPADDKKTTRLIVASVMRETLASLDIQYPEQTPERQQELQAIREKLLAEAPAVS